MPLHVPGHSPDACMPLTPVQASDWTFVYVESSQHLSAAADRYSIVQMTTVEQIVWFFGSLANIMAFILCWLFIFDSTKLEIEALDQAQRVRALLFIPFIFSLPVAATSYNLGRLIKPFRCEVLDEAQRMHAIQLLPPYSPL